MALSEQLRGDDRHGGKGTAYAVTIQYFQYLLPHAICVVRKLL